MKKAFSLIELLISLIIISMITAAFSPILIKKLKRSSVASAQTGVMAKCDKINTNCKLCIKDTCIKCDLNCSSNQYKDTANCVCKNCSSFSAACLSCNLTGCLRCQTGYGLINGTCTACAQGWMSDGLTACKTPCNGYKDSNGVCRSCPSGQYFHLNTCLKCSLYDPACTSCDSNGCLTCQSGYQLDSVSKKCNKILSWQPPTSQKDCDPYNAIFIAGGANICVTKFNAGDPGGPPLASDLGLVIKKGMQAPTTCNGRCCWSGGFTSGETYITTASTTNYFMNNNDFCTTLPSLIAGEAANYGGCTRSVCQYQAAVDICTHYRVSKMAEEKWNLPDSTDLRAIEAEYYTKSVAKGKNGLQLCENKLCHDLNTAGHAVPVKNPDGSYNTSAGCGNSGAAKCPPLALGCHSRNSDDWINSCTPATLWGLNLGAFGVRGVARISGTNIYDKGVEIIVRDGGGNPDAARSVRCVLKKVYK